MSPPWPQSYREARAGRGLRARAQPERPPRQPEGGSEEPGEQGPRGELEGGGGSALPRRKGLGNRSASLPEARTAGTGRV